MQVKPSQAMTIIAKAVRARLVPMMIGSPGTGKSSIVHAVAKKYNLLVIDLRLAQCDPTDLMGFPTIVGERAGYRPMETFPIEGDPLPKKPDGTEYAGWLLFLDEFNSASIAVQAAAYKIVLDHMVGQKPLHSHCAIVCAGNKEDDNAIVQPMSTALQSRLMHMELVSDVPEWLDWAFAHGVDRRITSYIQSKPQSLYAFRADHTDHTYACNRTWEFADRVLKVTDDTDPDRLPMLAGCISEGEAREFNIFCKLENDLPKIPAIVDDPTGIRVPVEPSVLFLLSGSIAHSANDKNLPQLLKFIDRMPKEFQVVCLRELVRRNRPVMQHPAIRKWIADNSTELF